MKIMSDNTKYVDNKVYKFRIDLDSDISNRERNVYVRPSVVKPFIDSLRNMHGEEHYKHVDDDERFVQEKYFTKERIEELKEEVIDAIRKSQNPFTIYCCDKDGDYLITDKDIFEIDD